MLNSTPEYHIITREQVPISSLFKRKVYLAGPMRGLPKFNKPAFDEVAKMLRRAGAKVFNPAESDSNIPGFSQVANENDGILPYRSRVLRKILHYDMRMLCLWADDLLLLPNWQKSEGALAEYCLAKAIGIRILSLQELQWKDFTAVKILLLEAQK